MQSSAAIDRLPAELLGMVLSIVHEEDPKSLRAVIRTSQSLRAAALPYYLSRICFNSHWKDSNDERHGDGLDRDLDCFIASCSQSNALHHVRWIVIQEKNFRKRSEMDYLKKTEEALARKRNTRWSLENHIYRGNPDDMLNTSSDDSEFFLRNTHKPVSLEEDAQWKPLADALEKMSGLQDFIFRVNEQLPPCLLQVLQRSLPNCRLHMPSFQFRSVQNSITDPHEIAIVSAPQLRTLGVLYETINNRGEADYGLEATKYILNGIVSNLTQLKFHDMPVRGTMDRYDAYQRPRKPWKGLSPGPWDQMRSLEIKAKLEHLDGAAFKPQEWNSLIHLEVLKHLEIDHRLDAEDFQWMGVHRPFQNLKWLAIHVECVDDPYLPQTNKSEETALFFEGLPPLEELWLDGLPGNTLPTKILQRHGCTLTHLHFMTKEPMYLASNCADQIRRHCPTLEVLTIPIQRKMGTKEEVEQYEALAGLPRLREARIALQCSYADERFDVSGAPVIIQRRYGNWEKVPRNRDFTPTGETYEALVNAAVDEELSRSIWRIITSAQRNHPLQHLSLGARSADVPRKLESAFPCEDYVLKRDVADDAVHYVETGKKREGIRAARRKLQAERKEEYDKYHRWEHQPNDPHVWLFRQIWPEEREGSCGLVDEWKSLPLQE